MIMTLTMILTCKPRQFMMLISVDNRIKDILDYLNPLSFFWEWNGFYLIKR